MIRNAAICTIGDEILIGQILDTNSAFIAQGLNQAGIKVEFTLSLQDSEKQIFDGLTKCLENTDLVIVTGGLGPTKDDITKEVLRKLSGSALYRESAEQLEIIKEFMSRRGIELTDNNRAQALVPDKAEVIVNKRGTAPCLLFRLPGEKMLVSMAGVPFEAEYCFGELLKILKNENRNSIFHRTILTFGIPESILAKRIENWEDNLPEGFKLAYLPNPLTGVKLRLSKYSGNAEENARVAEGLVQQLKEIIGDAIYGEGDSNMQLELGKVLLERKATLSVAESCTGGLISALITENPGSSEYYKGSVTSYANEIKINVLGVNADTIEKHGAVSEECVREMAAGVRKLMNTDYSIATSGIAGPGGGLPDKPVGTVWIAVAGPDFLISEKFVFTARRKQNMQRFAAHAVNLLRLSM